MIGHLRSRGLRLGIVSNCFAEDVATWPNSLLATSEPSLGTVEEAVSLLEGAIGRR